MPCLAIPLDMDHSRWHWIIEVKLITPDDRSKEIVAVLMKAEDKFFHQLRVHFNIGPDPFSVDKVSMSRDTVAFARAWADAFEAYINDCERRFLS